MHRPPCEVEAIAVGFGELEPRAHLERGGEHDDGPVTKVAALAHLLLARGEVDEADVGVVPRVFREREALSIVGELPVLARTLGRDHGEETLLLVGVRGIDEDQADDIVGVGGRVRAHVPAAEGVPDQHVGWHDPCNGEERAKVNGRIGGGHRAGRSVAPTQPDAVVGAGT